MSDETLRAFEEWVQGHVAHSVVQTSELANAFVAGTEWMRSECERIALGYPIGVEYSSNIVLIRAVCDILVKRMKEHGGTK